MASDEGVSLKEVTNVGAGRLELESVDGSSPMNISQEAEFRAMATDGISHAARPRRPGSRLGLAALMSFHGLPIAIAIAAARNGNGSDTAARNQTNRAGMKGISQSISR